MKFCAYLLTGIVLLLTALPCVDKPADSALHKMEISTNSHDENHSSDEDHCSPFCTCHCCQTNCFLSCILNHSGISGTDFCYQELISNYKDIDLFTIPDPPKA